MLRFTASGGAAPTTGGVSTGGDTTVDPKTSVAGASVIGSGACKVHSLGEIVMAAQQAYPELAGIDRIFDRNGAIFNEPPNEKYAELRDTRTGQRLAVYPAWDPLFGGLLPIHPEWSPDGKKIAFGRLGGDWYADITVMDADGGGERVLTRDVQVLV